MHFISKKIIAVKLLRQTTLLLLLLISSAAIAGKPFRFVFLTDTHIDTSNPPSIEDAERAVADINQLDSVGFVLVGGDVSDKGDVPSLRKAKEIFDKLKVPYYPVGGNHDFRWKHGDGETNFNMVFGDNKFEFKYNGFRFVGFSTAPEEHKNEGHVLEHNIEWLKVTLKKSGHKKPVFIITHYPLQKGDVDNYKKAMEVLSKYNVQAILNGHYHRNLFLNCSGIPSVVMRSALRGDKQNGGYTLLEVADSLNVYEKRIGKPQQLWIQVPLTKK